MSDVEGCPNTQLIAKHIHYSQYEVFVFLLFTLLGFWAFVAIWQSPRTLKDLFQTVITMIQ